MISGRTDANGIHGLDEALRRATAYLEAGADVLLIEAPRSIEEVRTITKTFAGVPLLFNWLESGKLPPVSLAEIHECRYKLVIYSVSLLFATTHTLLGALDVLKQGKTSEAFASNMVTFSQFTDHIGLPEIQKMEHIYGVS